MVYRDERGVMMEGYQREWPWKIEMELSPSQLETMRDFFEQNKTYSGKIVLEAEREKDDEVVED